MSKALELREKRAKAWEATKAFLDTKRGNNGLLSADDAATYDNMEADIVALGKEIERLERQAAIDAELSAATSTPLLGKPQDGAPEKMGRAADEYKSAFWDAMKIKNAPVKNALQEGTSSEGGYLVPDEFEKVLIDKLQEENVMRGICSHINTDSGDRKIPVVTSHGTAAWMDEEAAYTESDDAFGQVTLSAFKAGTIIKVSEELLNDSVFDLEGYLATEFARRIGALEEAGFVNGNGIGKPQGVFVGADAGVTAASATAITADELMDLFYAVKSGYRKNGTWLLNDSTIKAIRKLKTGAGEYLWQPSLVGGQPDMLLNRPIVTSSNAPVMATSAKAIAFGDFKYYWIADRQTRVFQRLNELYAANGQVGFRGFERVDGKLMVSEAIKVLAMHA